MNDVDDEPDVVEDHVLYLFWTETGSAYEYDPDCLRIRRLSGHAPTPLQGEDRVWNPIACLLEPLALDRTVTIIWSVSGASAPATYTGRVVRFEAWWGCWRTADEP